MKPKTKHTSNRRLKRDRGISSTRHHTKPLMTRNDSRSRFARLVTPAFAGASLILWASFMWHHGVGGLLVTFEANRLEALTAIAAVGWLVLDSGGRLCRALQTLCNASAAVFTAVAKRLGHLAELAEQL